MPIYLLWSFDVTLQHTLNNEEFLSKYVDHGANTFENHCFAQSHVLMMTDGQHLCVAIKNVESWRRFEGVD